MQLTYYYISNCSDSNTTDMRKIFALVSIAAFAVLAGCTPENTDSVKETPVIQAQETVSVEAAGGDITVSYTIDNPVEGQHLTADAEDCGWLSIKETAESSVTATVSANESEESRSAEITLSYPGAENITVTVTQEGTASGKPDDDDDDFIQDTGLSFQIDIVSFGSRSVTVNCIPSDLEATYIATTAEAEDFYAYEENSREFFEAEIEYMLEWGPYFGGEGLSDAEYIELFLRKGAMENYEIESLSTPASPYVFYAFGLTSDGTITSKVFKKDFNTAEPEMQDCTFGIIVRPALDGTRINVVPSSIYVQYYWNIMPKSEYDSYGEDAAMKIAQELLEEAEASGTGMGQILCYHNQNKVFSELTGGETYVAFAFGCDVSGYVTTETEKVEFTARTLEKINCSFNVNTTDIQATNFQVEIVPSDQKAKYFAYTLPYETLEAYVTPEAMTEDVLDQLCYYMGLEWVNSEEVGLVHTGTQTLSNYDMMGKETMPETRQFVGVVAISDYATMISDLMFTSVLTKDHDGSGDMLRIEIDILDKNAASASVRFTPIPDEGFKYGVLPTSFFEGIESDKDKIAAIMSYYVVNNLHNTMQSYSETVYNPTDLSSGTEYMAFAFGYNEYFMGETLFSETFVAE